MKQQTRTTWIIAGIAGVAILAGLLVVLYFAVWQQPGKQDFESASKSAKEISNNGASKPLGEFVVKINEQSRVGLTQPKLAESAAAEKQKVDNAINARVAQNEKLKSSLVLRDEQVKKAYDKYAAKEAKYRTYIVGYTVAYPAYESSYTTCKKVFQINDQAGDDLTKYASLHRKAAAACIRDLDNVITSPITPLADYAKEFKRIVNERQKVFDGLEKKTLDTDVARSRIKALSEAYIKNDRTEALKEFIANSRFNGELNDFIKLLDDKAKASK